MPRIIYNGRIDGEFEGFSDEVLFRMMDGTYWIQDQYKYWYHQAHNPPATIIKQGDRFILQVAGEEVPVRRAVDIIESRIDGEFKGWEGASIYKLTNGQTWQQSSHKYEYKHSHMPWVVIYRDSGGYKMAVAGTIANVRQIG